MGQGGSLHLVGAHHCKKYGPHLIILTPSLVAKNSRLLKFWPIDPMMQPIQMGVRQRDHCNSRGSRVCFPFTWIIRWAPVWGVKGCLQKKRRFLYTHKKSAQSWELSSWVRQHLARVLKLNKDWVQFWSTIDPLSCCVLLAHVWHLYFRLLFSKCLKQVEAKKIRAFGTQFLLLCDWAK